MKNKITQIINEEISNFSEAEHIPLPDFKQLTRDTSRLNKPLKDNDTIIVYHGYYNSNDAILTAKFGLSGKERASRVYSYEAVNNPKGLFVSVSFDQVKRNFAGSGVIIEFATKVSDLEAPVWAGSDNYFVQGDYTGRFDSEDEREQQRLNYRDKHNKSENLAIVNSDRPELAYSLYESSENQALFIGDLNPNMIRAFWVNEKLKDERLHGGQWERMDRNSFIKKYYNEDDFNQTTRYGNREETRPSDKFLNKKNKYFQPAEDFDLEKLKEKLHKDWGIGRSKEEVYNIFMENIIEPWDKHYIYSHFYPKQIKQMEHIYKKYITKL